LSAVTVNVPEVVGLTTNAPEYWLVLNDDKPAKFPVEAKNVIVMWLYRSWYLKDCPVVKFSIKFCVVMIDVAGPEYVPFGGKAGVESGMVDVDKEVDVIVDVPEVKVDVFVPEVVVPVAVCVS
jgi:hypothetical protein